MNKNNHIYELVPLVLIALFLLACSANFDPPNTHQPNFSNNPKQRDNPENQTGTDQRDSIRYLALGDSYTVGTSVAAKENFPSQLATALFNKGHVTIDSKIIAHNGWTTANLLNAIDQTPTNPPYQLVSLLIGVNNQYQGLPFSKYKSEFPKLLKFALKMAGGKTAGVVVLSIPDYSYTPFGQGANPQSISRELDNYNKFARSAANKMGITFIDITDITRGGLEDPDLVANDDLHPSGKAYKLFVERMLPIVVPRVLN
ncbi:SGNH/GDSL hydrolase family protein [Flavobacteriaceae bacterium F89]|uniref:SGNH/GDSL hydrolase family protein n=1 Tax=Cerina litoralis TaxID=2874477 RepID=A0AAE3ETB0_9FLAO|nr:SGNH/GDSL hydrolase family protein [Cerina litoralis]MCG2459814.1 SGNH/GDSL hydrolase family protein [Cerina litoralis]